MQLYANKLKIRSKQEIHIAETINLSIETVFYEPFYLEKRMHINCSNARAMPYVTCALCVTSRGKR